MLSIAYILIRERMQRHVAGARAGDPVIPAPPSAVVRAEQSARQPLDPLRPA
jgi:hypothetical protein